MTRDDAADPPWRRRPGGGAADAPVTAELADPTTPRGPLNPPYAGAGRWLSDRRAR